MILILSDKFDVHADLVCSKLNESKAKYFRLNLDKDSMLTATFTYINNEFHLQQSEKNIKSSDISCVWTRRVFIEFNLGEEPDSISDVGTKIWKGEWDRCLIGLYHSLKNLPWLNKLENSYRAENKFFQYSVANQIGLKTPPTITSNNKKILFKFQDDNNIVVLKMLNQGFYMDIDGIRKGMYVNKVKKTDFDTFQDVNENPITLQKYLDKSYEVRYTVVGNDHHVCKIESQKSEIAKTDWRRYDLANTPHSIITPPDFIKVKVITLMEKLEIEFGAFDFIVSSDNMWTFLEVNSMGQWLWIEGLTGTKISNSIANWLIKHNGD